MRSKTAKFGDRPGRPAPAVSVPRRDLRRRSAIRQHRGVVRSRSRRTSGRARTSRSTTCSPRTPRPNTSPMSPSRTCCADETGEPVRHPQVREMFDRTPDGHYAPKDSCSTDRCDPRQKRRGLEAPLFWILAPGGQLPAFALSCSSLSFLAKSSLFFATKSCSFFWRSSMSDCCSAGPSIGAGEALQR